MGHPNETLNEIEHREEIVPTYGKEDIMEKYWCPIGRLDSW